jgi:hypothetical protein
LEERLDRTQEVAGSSPASSIVRSPCKRGFRWIRALRNRLHGLIVYGKPGKRACAIVTIQSGEIQTMLLLATEFDRLKTKALA